MVITLINCQSKWLLKGIDPTTSGWHESLTNAINGYVTPIEGWDYDFETDELKISVSGTVTIPANIVDFGDGKAVELG